jgi:hypothetical protein
MTATELASRRTARPIQHHQSLNLNLPTTAYYLSGLQQPSGSFLRFESKRFYIAEDKGDGVDAVYIPRRLKGKEG